MTQPNPPTALDRLWDAFRRMVRGELAELRYYGVWEYQVTKSDGSSGSPATTVDCKPTDASISLPSLSSVPIFLPYAVTPRDNALCSIEFMNGDPSRPRCTGFDDPSEYMRFAGSPAPGAARIGDTVTVLLPPAVFVGSIVVGGTPSPATGAVVWAVPQTLGNITTGSAKVGIAT